MDDSTINTVQVIIIASISITSHKGTEMSLIPVEEVTLSYL